MATAAIPLAIAGAGGLEAAIGSGALMGAVSSAGLSSAGSAFGAAALGGLGIAGSAYTAAKMGPKALLEGYRIAKGPVKEAKSIVNFGKDIHKGTSHIINGVLGKHHKANKEMDAGYHNLDQISQGLDQFDGALDKGKDTAQNYEDAMKDVSFSFGK